MLGKFSGGLQENGRREVSIRMESQKRVGRNDPREKVN